MKDFFSSIIH